MKRTSPRTAVSADCYGRARDPVDRDEVEGVVAAAWQRERQVGRRRDDQQKEQIWTVEALDLARAGVAYDRCRAHDGDGDSVHPASHQLLGPSLRLLDDAPKGLTGLELLLENESVPISGDVGGRVEDEAIELHAACREFKRFVRAPDVDALTGLAVCADGGDLGAMVNTRHLTRERLELRARQSEIDGARVSLDELHAIALLHIQARDVGARLFDRRGARDGEDVCARVGPQDLRGNRACEGRRKAGEKNRVVDHGRISTLEPLG